MLERNNDLTMKKKYIESEKLIAEIERFSATEYDDSTLEDDVANGALDYVLEKIIPSLQQEHSIEGKQVIIITETDGDVNIHWDCRSLGDVRALLASAQSFIADKQVDELRGQGSGPDYNTIEGRFRNAHKFQQEQPDVDLEKEIDDYMNPIQPWEVQEAPFTSLENCARHFYELGKNSK